MASGIASQIRPCLCELHYIETDSETQCEVDERSDPFGSDRITSFVILKPDFYRFFCFGTVKPAVRDFPVFPKVSIGAISIFPVAPGVSFIFFGNGKTMRCAF